MIEPIVYILISVVIFLGFQRLQKRVGLFILNPLLLSLFTIVSLLVLMGRSYDEYMLGGQYLSMLIEPGVVALGYPLFKQLKLISKQWRQLLFICVIAVFVVLTCSALMAKFFGVDDWVIRSLVTLCITTAIAMETSEALGGVPSLAAITVMIAGFTGSSVGLTWLKFWSINDPRVQGLAIGSTAHALGTATIASHSYQSAAFASTALILCAILTALVAPLYIPFLLSF